MRKIIKRALRKYERDGVYALLVSAFRFVFLYFKKILNIPFLFYWRVRGSRKIQVFGTKVTFKTDTGAKKQSSRLLVEKRKESFKGYVI